MEKKTTKKPAAKKPAAAKKPRAPKKKAEVVEAAVVEPKEAVAVSAPAKLANGKYIFATGRRKTAIANVRLFEGTGDLVVNQKPFKTYFFHTLLQETALRPLALTGLQKQYFFSATINGGGMNAQAHALRHGISKALATLSLEVRKVLKKNGMLTRDDRKKERKKPGLKRARRSPQWAKR